MQNSLDRLFEGIATSLRETVLPAVEDPYARSQVTAAIELLGNIGARVQWRADQIDQLVGRIREVLGGTGAALPDPTGDPLEDRRSHLAALAEACKGEIDDAVRDLLLEDLAVEFERLRTGAYR
ncbi:MAG TPA: hypothetical protein VLD62_12060 [Acidimicrobiia bacterium]|nr:hypothetical protein [Acidimicrobiia bacterium]